MQWITSKAFFGITTRVMIGWHEAYDDLDDIQWCEIHMCVTRRWAGFNSLYWQGDYNIEAWTNGWHKADEFLKFLLWMKISVLTWHNDGPAYWRMYISGGHNELTVINDIAVTSSWASWRLISPAPWVLAHPFVQTQIKKTHQSSASLAFVRGIPPWQVDSSYQGLVTRKMIPFDEVIVNCCWNVVLFASCAILGNNINIMPYTIPISWFIFKSDISMYHFLWTKMLGVYTMRETYAYFHSVCIDLMPMTF